MGGGWRPPDGLRDWIKMPNRQGGCPTAGARRDARDRAGPTEGSDHSSVNKIYLFFFRFLFARLYFFVDVFRLTFLRRD